MSHQDFALPGKYEPIKEHCPRLGKVTTIRVIVKSTNTMSDILSPGEIIKPTVNQVNVS